MLHLNKFINCFYDSEFISKDICNLLASYSLSPRYVYSNADKSRMLIQAGGSNGIDSALITVIDLTIYTIEFKEPGAKTSEPDLPKYGEDGNIRITKEFLNKYPQFKSMLLEHKDINFFDLMGKNEHNFSHESVNVAVTNNYSKKYADVICTEDENGYLVMMPANQISIWADIEGEIRPAGRNSYNVWTPNASKRFLEEKGATINNDIVYINKDKLEIRRQRGGNSEVSGYKINPLFFIYKSNCIEKNNVVSFNISSVRQLNPTVAGKMGFKKLRYKKIKDYYSL